MGLGVTKMWRNCRKEIRRVLDETEDSGYLTEKYGEHASSAFRNIDVIENDTSIHLFEVY